MKNVHERIKEFLQNRHSGAQQLAGEALEIIIGLYNSNTTSSEILEFLNKCALQFYQMVPIIKLDEYFKKNGVNEISIIHSGSYFLMTHIRKMHLLSLIPKRECSHSAIVHR